MMQKLLLTLMLVSPFVVTSIVNGHAMENSNSACLRTCNDAWKIASDAYKTKFQNDKAQFLGCINSIGNKKLLCNQGC